MNNNLNPIYQNVKIKRFAGWFMAVIFPFAAVGMRMYTKAPILTAIAYWFLCGIILRYALSRKLPYFKLQVNKIKIEIVIIVTVTVLFLILYVKKFNINYNIDTRGTIELIVFAILNGCFEPLVLTNIFDLAGCKSKIKGLGAVIVFMVMMYFVFWRSYVFFQGINIIVFALFQGLILLVPLEIYLKTKDITIWCIQSAFTYIAVILFSNLYW